MTKREFLKIARDAKYCWKNKYKWFQPYFEKSQDEQLLQFTCEFVSVFFGGLAREDFSRLFFNLCYSTGDKRGVCWDDKIENPTPSKINSCRIIFFYLWVELCLEEKTYKRF